jgi:hypothetical protein
MRDEQSMVKVGCGAQKFLTKENFSQSNVNLFQNEVFYVKKLAKLAT